MEGNGEMKVVVRAGNEGYKWLILMVGCLALACYSIDMIALAPIFDAVSRDLLIDMGTAVHLAMAFALTLAVAMILGGWVVDRYGITAVFVGGLICASLPATLMPWIGHSYKIVFAARLVQGLVAVTFATMGPIITRWFPERQRGMASGILMCSLSVGTAVGVIASPAIFDAVGTWQRTIALLSIPGWITIVLALMITRKPPPAETGAFPAREGMVIAGTGASYGQLFLWPVTWIGSFIVFFSSWGMYALYNLIPAYLASPPPLGVGLGPIASGKISLTLALIGVPAFITGGMFFDKVAKGNSRPAVVVGFVMTGVFAYLLLQPGVFLSMPLLIACLLIAGWGASFGSPSLSAFVAGHYPPHLVGSMVGWWFGFGTFGGALGTFMAGLAMQKTGSFYWALTPISLACAAGLVLTIFLTKGRSREGLSERAYKVSNGE